MPKALDDILQFALDNITWVIFLIFMLSGLFSRSGKKSSSTDPVSPAPREAKAESRPLAERMAEHFGIPLEEIKGQSAPQSQPAPNEQRYASEGRRSTTTGNVQDQYPDLFGGPGMFGDQKSDGSSNKEAQWGFDESEWGSTFEKHENQWGGAFPEKKSSDPYIGHSG